VFILNRKAKSMKRTCALITAFFLSVLLLPSIAIAQESPPEKSGAAKEEKIDFPEGAVALIGGKALFLEEVKDMCYERHGMQVIQGLINTKVIRAEAAKRNIKVTEEEIDKRYIDEISTFSSNAGLTDPVAAFKNYLRGLGMTMAAYKHGLETQIMLRKLLESKKGYQKPRVTDLDIKYGFEGMYGAKYNVQVIFASEKSDIEKARKQLEGGADFGEVSVKYSESDPLRATRGVLAPMSGLDLEARLGEENASLVKKLKQGQYTEPFYFQRGWHIMKLLQKTPALKKEMDKETEEELREQIYKGKLENAMNSYLRDLVSEYDVKVNRELLPEVGKGK